MADDLSVSLYALPRTDATEWIFLAAEADPAGDALTLTHEEALHWAASSAEGVPPPPEISSWLDALQRAAPEKARALRTKAKHALDLAKFLQKKDFDYYYEDRLGRGAVYKVTGISRHSAAPAYADRLKGYPDADGDLISSTPEMAVAAYARLKAAKAGGHVPIGDLAAELTRSYSNATLCAFKPQATAHLVTAGILIFSITALGWLIGASLSDPVGGATWGATAGSATATIAILGGNWATGLPPSFCNIDSLVVEKAPPDLGSR